MSPRRAGICGCGAKAWRVGARCRACHLAMLPIESEAHFWAKVDRSAGPDACWPWTGLRTPLGYGRCGSGESTTTAHRKALRYSGVEVPRGVPVLHSCDNPPCCNPAHLRVGTFAENARDMALRRRSTFGERNPQARLSEAQVVSIRRAALSRSNRELAADYGVDPSTISLIVSRRRWAHVA